jgi:very-short-patch-repair endonuclease
MRASPTRAERLLWQHLRRRGLGGLRFRRQHVVGRFIVDFYCAERRLVIEVDGDVHLARAARDHQRTEILNALGLTVLCILNEDVLLDIRSVLARILASARDPRD